MRRSPLKASPDVTRAFQQRARTNSTRKRRAVSPASSEQRAKVRDSACVACGGSGLVDPAHLWPRSQGGCDSPECVVPLCRIPCHSDFDEGRLDLSPVLALPEFAAERAHMASHGSLVSCLQRLSGKRVEFV